MPPRRGQFTKTQAPAAAEKLMQDILSGAFKPDVVFTTYDQMNTIKGDETSRRRFMSSLAPRSFLIMDESHNAGGQGQEKTRGKSGPVPRAEKFREWVQAAKSVMYSSATYAKNPQVMDLYSRTDMSKAVAEPKDLPDLIAKGKVPLQQIVASMLSDAGQYARRERSFDGVEYGLEVAPVDQDNYAAFAESIRTIFDFDRSISEFRKEWIETFLKENGAGLGMDAGVGDMAANSTEFASIMHNIVNQMLLAIKADSAADAAIKALRAGEKPVVALAFTNESFITDYADDNSIQLGDEINISFTDVVRRYLDRTLRITVKMSDDTKQHVFIPVGELPGDLRAMHDLAKETVEAADLSSLPVSPIDWIRDRIKKAGFSVAEITGRGTMIDYANGNSMRFTARPSTEQGAAGKRVSIKKYNDGNLDALIINRSGSTGVSLHASSKFKDQRRRRMIIAQAEANIDTHMQTLGRVHRTGQVLPPAYTQLSADIPAEARPTAVLMKKMASLSANTTASRKSAFTADAVDFMNEYGDLAAVQWAKQNADINLRLGTPIRFDDKGKLVGENPIQKLTGRIMLLDPKGQQELLDTLTETYSAILAQKEALGENALEAKALDLQAEPVSSTEIKPATGASPFQAAATMEKMLVKSTGRAMKPRDVVDSVADALGRRPQTWNFPQAIAELQRFGQTKAQNTIERVGAEHRKWTDFTAGGMKDPIASQAARAKAAEQFKNWAAIIRMAPIGSHVTLSTGADSVDAKSIPAVVIGIKESGKAKSPTAASAWSITFALPDSMRMLTMPFSQIGTSKDDPDASMIMAPAAWNDRLDALEKKFDLAAREGKEERYIATGNLLSAFDQLNGKGQIIQFTDAKGDVKPGIMMPRGFSETEWQKERRIRFATAAQAIEFLKQSESKEIVDDKDHITVTNTYRGVIFTANAGRAKGGRYFTDDSVRKIYDNWTKQGGDMVATVDLPRAMLLIEAMQKIGAKFVAPSEPELAQSIVYPKRAESKAYQAKQADLPTAPSGWESAGGYEVPTLTREQQQEVSNIVARVSGIPETQFKSIITVPRSGPAMQAWGESGPGDAEANGYYSSTVDTASNKTVRATITVSMRATNGPHTAYHEAFHHLQGVFLNDAERRILVAERERLKALVGQSRNSVDNISQKELEAEAFAVYAMMDPATPTACGSHRRASGVGSPPRDHPRRAQLPQRAWLLDHGEGVP